MSEEVTQALIGEVLAGVVARADAELYAKQESELEQCFYWRWEEGLSVEWNTYQFSDMLERYKRACRQWEEKHNGSFCVVERVREKYVMPRVREFLAELASCTSASTLDAERNKGRKQENDTSVAFYEKALKDLSFAMQIDPDYAWSWHCNIAMAAQDAGAPHKEANERAADFMRRAFDVDTTKPPIKPEPYNASFRGGPEARPAGNDS